MIYVYSRTCVLRPNGYAQHFPDSHSLNWDEDDEIRYHQMGFAYTASYAYCWVSSVQRLFEICDGAKQEQERVRAIRATFHQGKP